MGRFKMGRWSRWAAIASMSFAGVYMWSFAGAAHARASTQGYVTVQGTQLYLNGHPWAADGFNAYQAMSVDFNHYTCGGAYSDSTIDAEFQKAQDAGASAIRVWFFQGYAVVNGQISYWWPFDRVLSHAYAHGLKVIATLVDEWDNCGVQYGSNPWVKDYTWYQSGYKTTPWGGNPLTYRDWVGTVVGRYAGDTRIAFWQLVNEAEVHLPYPCPGDAAAVIRAFADDVATYIKSIDPNHLVSLGTMGAGQQCGTTWASTADPTMSDYDYIHDGAIDICEQHSYWSGVSGWGNPCAAIGKPYFVGERGTVSGDAFGMDCFNAFNTQASGYLQWTLFDIGYNDPSFQPLHRCFNLRWGSTTANASAVSLPSENLSIASVSTDLNPPVSYPTGSAENDFGPLTCDAVSSPCPGGLTGISLQTPNETTFGTLETTTPIPGSCSEVPALNGLAAPAAVACSAIAQVGLTTPVTVEADNVQSEAVSQSWGDTSSASVYIGDLNVAGTQIIGGANPIIETPSPAPNTWVGIHDRTLGVCVGLNVQRSVPGGVTVSAVVVEESAFACGNGRDLVDIGNAQAGAAV